MFLKQAGKITSPEQVFENENVRNQSSISGLQETVSIPDNNHAPISDSLFQGQPLIENNLPLPQSTGNVSSVEYILTELQPRNFQPPTCVPSSSQGEYPQNASWFAELNELSGQNDIDQQEGEDSIFHDVEEEVDGASEVYSEIQQCLTLNRDYQVVILFCLSLTSPFAQFLLKLCIVIKVMFAWNTTMWQSLGSVRIWTEKGNAVYYPSGIKGGYPLMSKQV